MGLIRGSERSSGGGHGEPLQYCCLENPTDRGAQQVQSMVSQRGGHDWSDLAHKQLASISSEVCLCLTQNLKWQWPKHERNLLLFFLSRQHRDSIMESVITSLFATTVCVYSAFSALLVFFLIGFSACLLLLGKSPLYNLGKKVYISNTCWKHIYSLGDLFLTILYILMNRNIQF